MTKADIVDQIAERTGLTKKDVAETVDNFLNAVARALANGHHIEIRGFGTFRVKDRKSRIARNPRTGEAVPVPPRRVPVFKVSKELLAEAVTRPRTNAVIVAIMPMPSVTVSLDSPLR